MTECYEYLSVRNRTPVFMRIHDSQSVACVTAGCITLPAGTRMVVSDANGISVTYSVDKPCAPAKYSHKNSPEACSSALKTTFSTSTSATNKPSITSPSATAGNTAENRPSVNMPKNNTFTGKHEAKATKDDWYVAMDTLRRMYKMADLPNNPFTWSEVENLEELLFRENYKEEH